MKRMTLYMAVFLMLTLLLWGCAPRQDSGAPIATGNGGSVDETKGGVEIDLLPEDPSTDPPGDVSTDAPADISTDPPTASSTNPPTDAPVNPPVDPTIAPPTNPPTAPPAEGGEEPTSQEGIQLPVIPG